MEESKTQIAIINKTMTLKELQEEAYRIRQISRRHWQSKSHYYLHKFRDIRQSIRELEQYLPIAEQKDSEPLPF